MIAYRVGNDYVMEIERLVAGKHGTGIFNGVRIDEIWTNPQHARTCRSFFETVYRCQVRIVPHIWDSFFIDKLIGELPSGLRFGYVPGAQDKRIAIFEPNINVVKTAHYPMLVCEAAYRQDPSGIGDIFVTNAIDLKRHEAFERFALGLDIVQAGKASFEARYSTPYFLARFTDIVVTHQWENGLNYLYYDAAYGRYPLVHNSDLLSGFGYQYASFDAQDGARALREAVRQHDARLEEYEQACQALLDGVSIRNTANVTAYDALLRGVCGGAGLAPAVA